MSKGHLIIIGASARAAAQSAIRAGYEPWCIDLFADRDLQAIAPVKRCPREQWPQGILELMKDAPPGPVLLTGAMENHLNVVTNLATRLPGSDGHVAMIRDMRSAYTLRHLSNREMIQWCDSPWPPPPWASNRAGRWLVKAKYGGSGSRVRIWAGETVSWSGGEYLQKRIEGTPISFSMLNDGKQSTHLFGVTEQLIGDDAFGARAFQYCGSIFPHRLSTKQYGDVVSGWSSLFSRFHGPFGIDALIDRSGRIRPVEINPRYTASTEVIERATGRAILRGTSVGWEKVIMDGWTRHDLQYSKAVVFARTTCRAPDLSSYLSSEDIADVPQIGEVVEQGHPICTVFAQGPTRDACYAGLRDMAAKVYTRLQPA